MTTMAEPIITCPVCGSHGSMLHHDLRSSLVYSCLKCTHEWEIDPADAAAATESAVIEHPPGSVRGQVERAIFHNSRS